MFWEIAPEGAIGRSAELNCAKIEREGKRRKNKMEEASRWSWTANENSPRALQRTEYTSKEFLEIFVDDRPFWGRSVVREC